MAESSESINIQYNWKKVLKKCNTVQRLSHTSLHTAESSEKKYTLANVLQEICLEKYTITHLTTQSTVIWELEMIWARNTPWEIHLEKCTSRNVFSLKNYTLINILQEIHLKKCTSRNAPQEIASIVKTQIQLQSNEAKWLLWQTHRIRRNWPFEQYIYTFEQYIQFVWQRQEQEER